VVVWQRLYSLQLTGLNAAPLRVMGFVPAVGLGTSDIGAVPTYMYQPHMGEVGRIYLRGAIGRLFSSCAGDGLAGYDVARREPLPIAAVGSEGERLCC